jgi:hypothetical protein
MNIKRSTVLVVLLFLFLQTAWCDNYEFSIHTTSNTSFSITVTRNSYAWMWNTSQSNIILCPWEQKTFSNVLSASFDSPDSPGLAPQGVMPLGAYTFCCNNE